MADSILDTVNAAYESLEAPEGTVAPEAPQEAPADAPPEETAEQTAQRTRDEAGRFAKEPKQPKEPRETLKLKAKPQEAPSPDVTNAGTLPNAVSGVPAAPPEKVPAPQEWGGLAKVKWDRLPVDVQKEIASHEQTRMAATADLMPVKELIDVNREFLVNQAGSVSNAMTQMMQFARMSVDNPVALAEHILRARGIDPQRAFAGQPQAPQQAQPQDLQSYVAQLVQQAVQPVLTQAEQAKQLQEQQETLQLQSTINQFAADPKYPFFNDVKFDMGMEIEKAIRLNQPITMEQAYERATWGHPQIRAHLQQAEREASEKANAANAQKARAAQRTSVTGSPIAGVEPSGGRSKGSTLDAVRQAYADLSEG